MKKLVELFKKTTNRLDELFLVGVVWAQNGDITIEPPDTFSQLGDITIPQIIGTVIKWILIIAAVLAFIFLVWGGLKWITSGGDKEGTAKAQSTITAALIGLVIVFAAWAIVRLLGVFFGFDIFGGLTLPAVGG